MTHGNAICREVPGGCACGIMGNDKQVWAGRYTRVVHGIRPGWDIVLYYLEHYDTHSYPFRFTWTYAFTNKRKAIAAARATDMATRRAADIAVRALTDLDLKKEK